MQIIVVGSHNTGKNGASIGGIHGVGFCNTHRPGDGIRHALIGAGWVGTARNKVVPDVDHIGIGIVDKDLLAGGVVSGGIGNEEAVLQVEREGLGAGRTIIGIAKSDGNAAAVVGGGVGVEGRIDDGSAGAQADAAAPVGGGVGGKNAVFHGGFFEKIRPCAKVRFVAGEGAAGEGGGFNKMGAAAVVAGGGVAGESTTGERGGCTKVRPAAIVGGGDIAVEGATDERGGCTKLHPAARSGGGGVGSEGAAGEHSGGVE